MVQADLLKERARDIVDRMMLTKHPDALWGSPSCQGFSRARYARGHRKGDGELLRHAVLKSLYLRPVDFAAILKPRFVAVENVRGILDRGNVQFVRWLRADLKTLGYGTDVWEVDALDYGGCQTRHRVIVVGKLHGAIPPKPERIKRPEREMHLRWVIGYLTEEEAMKDGIAPMSNSWRQRLPGIAQGANLQTKGGSHHHRYVFDQPCPPLMTGPFVGGTMKSVHPEKHRFMTVREFCCIMGVPQYRFPATMPVLEKYRIVGQAVPPFLARAVIDRLTA